jgi:RecA-family ATPase
VRHGGAPSDARTSRRPHVSGDKEKPKPAPIIPKLVFPSSLRGLPIPEMEWIVDGWIPIGDVTLLYGDGGVGKTLLAQELMASTAIGAPWCTLPARRCKSLGVFCEDDGGELHRRQNDIQRFLETDFHDDRMDNMAWWCRKGDDNLLCTFDYEGVIQLTPFYFAILDAAKDMGARLVILDTAADLFGGNENDRGQVRQFMSSLSRIAMMINGAVVLCAHPSKSGMAAGGSMDSGSTGWSNSARSRLALERVKAEGDEQVDTDERILSKKKANRSSIGETIKLRWHDGVIASTRAPGIASSTVLADALDVDGVFLALLAQTEEEGRPVSANPRAGNYAPKSFGRHASRQGFGKRELEQAMERLFATKRITTEEYGKTTGSGVRPRRIAVVTKAEGD